MELTLVTATTQALDKDIVLRWIEVLLPSIVVIYPPVAHSLVLALLSQGAEVIVIGIESNELILLSCACQLNKFRRFSIVQEPPDRSVDLVCVGKIPTTLIRSESYLFVVDIPESLASKLVSDGYSSRRLSSSMVAITLRSDRIDCCEWTHQLNELKYLREKHKYQEAYDLAQKLLVTLPSSEYHRIYYELSIVTYYTHHKEQGREYCDSLLFSMDAQGWQRSNVYINQKFYIGTLPTIRSVDLVAPHLEGYVRANPALIATSNGYVGIIRMVNYMLPSGSKASVSIIKTKNIVIHVDKKYHIRSWTLLQDSSNINHLHRNIIRGLEDIRLFTPTQFFCTALGFVDPCMPRIAWGELNNEGQVISLRHLDITPHNKCEKNWLPFIHRDEPHFIYSIDPLRIYRLNNGDPILLCVQTAAPNVLSDLRGSAPPIEYNEGYLLTVHTVHLEHNGSRIYYHRLAWLSSSFDQLRLSRSFYFEDYQIEYNLGLTSNSREILLSYSTRDCTAKIAVIDRDIINEYLQDHCFQLKNV